MSICSTTIETKTDQKSKEKANWKAQEMRSMEENVHKIWRSGETSQTKFYLTNQGNPNKKFFATFPYPYMNGTLHLGHGFTALKCDFITRFHRACGHDVLNPFAFHLTGMPISAAADRLKNELKNITQLTDKNMSQYMIMKKMEINDDEIKKFVDPKYWGVYFPERAKITLDRLGYCYDSSRSFITTDADPYYDRFVKWHFINLFEKKALKFGTRHDLFSIKCNQPCLGHDRSVGEEAVPSKGNLIMFELLRFDESNNIFTDEISVRADTICVMVMTTRPETLYGVTNLWVDNDSTYNIYKVNRNNYVGYEVWVCQEHNMKSLMYQYREQDIFFVRSYEFISSVKGSELVGLTVYNPVRSDTGTFNNIVGIYSLPRQNIDSSLKIDSTKGTGIIMSVPSESPTDYICYSICNKNNDLSAPIRPIIRVTHTDYKGELMAVDLINKTKPKPNVKELTKIKEFCYVGSLTASVMLVGEFKENSVVLAHEKIVSKYFPTHIIPYYEPDQEAISRSGDRLIVAKMDQWFIDYSDLSWKKKAHKHINSMKFTDENVKSSLKGGIDWLEQWPCSRTYGMGTIFPEEIVGKDSPQYLIDSLSDSTIYMAMYTIYHFFKKHSIKPDEMTREVFDYIFLLKDYDNKKFSKFKPFREEFIHWYPVDVRVSARDLINNHLSMCILNHVIIWDDEFFERYSKYYPKRYENIKSFGPISYEVNGYIAVQKLNKSKEYEKMSKSKGNFKTLDQAIDIYTADSIRFTYASASTGVDDSYFDQDICTRTVEKLYKEYKWFEETLNIIDVPLAKPKLAESYPDFIFKNEMMIVAQKCVKSYKNMDFRNVITDGFHILQGFRDNYVNMCKKYDSTNPSIFKMYIKLYLSLIAPIMPHFCEFINQLDVFHRVFKTKKDNKVWETFSIDLEHIDSFDNLINPILHWENKYLSNIASDIMSRVSNLKKKTNKIKLITIYSAGDGDCIFADQVEKIAHQIYQKNYHRKILNVSEIIQFGMDINNDIMKDQKNTGSLIRYYKRIEELVDEFGKDWYDKRMCGKVQEHDVLSNYLEYYIKRSISDTYTIKFIKQTLSTDPELTPESAQKQRIPGVRINNPVIRYE